MKPFTAYPKILDLGSQSQCKTKNLEKIGQSFERREKVVII